MIIDIIEMKELKRAASGDSYGLLDAFFWETTREGHEYWKALFHSEKTLPAEVVDRLTEMYSIAEQCTHWVDIYAGEYADECREFIRTLNGHAIIKENVSGVYFSDHGAAIAFKLAFG